MTTVEYLQTIHSRFCLGESSEPTYRGDLPIIDRTIVDQLAEGLGLAFVPESFNPLLDNRGGEVCYAESSEVMPEYRQNFYTIDVLDYIYAVLHSPDCRETSREFWKLDFSSLPYPRDADKFWNLVKLGGKLRTLHLMESPALDQLITQYPVGGDNAVEKIRFEPYPDLTGFENLSGLSSPHGRVYINETQYFDSVPEVAWNFYIGGYQPAQKWLNDRKGRVLDFEDILHYQKIIKALVETDRVMREIGQIPING